MLQIVSPYGPGAASARVRVFSWVDRLPDQPIELSDYMGLPNARVRPMVSDPVALARAEVALRRLATRRVPRRLLFRQATPFSKGRIEARLLRNSDLGVYDFDDALQWDYRGRLRDAVFSHPGQTLHAVRSADRVIAGSDVLADWASEHCDDVRVIPSCVDPDAYPVKRDFEVGETFRFVWLGSPATEKYLTVVAPALLDLARRHPIRLTVISAGSSSLGELDTMVDRVRWSQSGFAQALLGADAAIAPLADEPFARGKCAYKVLQYAAAGLPAVVSSIGANAVVADRLGYAVASDTEQWTAQLMSLVTTGRNERRTAGQRARNAVVSHYSYSTWESAWKAAVGLL